MKGFFFLLIIKHTLSFQRLLHKVPRHNMFLRDLPNPENNLVNFGEAVNLYIRNSSSYSIPIPRNEFETRVLETILLNNMEKEKIELEREKLNFENKKLGTNIKSKRFQTLSLSIASIITACILIVGLINFGAGTNQAVDNVVNVLQRFVLVFEDFVLYIKSFKIRKMLFG